MNTRLAITLGILFLVSCGRNETQTQSSGSMFCTTSATVSSGDVNLANSQVQLSGLSVYIYNATTSGTFTLTLPDGTSTTTASSSFTYPNAFYVTTTSSGGVSSQVSVRDNSAGTTATCVLGISGTTTGTSTGTTTSSTSTGTGSAGASVSISGTTSSNSITLTATASGVSNPVYTYYYVNGNSLGITGSFSGATATLYSYTAGSIVIGVQAQSSSNSSVWARNQITITFGTSTGTGYTSLNCTLTHYNSVYYRGMNVPFSITSDTGEPLRITYWDAGEPWDYGGPALPLYIGSSASSYFYAAYGYAGTKTVRILAESATRSGVLCNGGNYLTDSLFIY